MPKKLNHISPLRFPGGKTKLYPIFTELCEKRKIENFYEVFAGGAGLGLKLLVNGKIKKLFLNDLDIGVWAFWFLLKHNPNFLIKKIKKTKITIKEWHTQKRKFQQQKDFWEHTPDINLLGWAFFFLNRTCFSGLITGGPIGGYEQTGKEKIDSRFRVQKIIEKIDFLKPFLSKIEISQYPFEKFINQSKESKSEKDFFYFDPPYFKKSKGLYKTLFSHKEHITLSKLIKEKFRKNWAVSYDNDPFIKYLYDGFSRFQKTNFNSAITKKTSPEILIFSK